MSNHSLINANGGTHLKIACLALAVSMVFVAAVSGFGGKADTGAHAYGPVVKANALINVAHTGPVVR
jgi:hypothetical protein